MSPKSEHSDSAESSGAALPLSSIAESVYHVDQSSVVGPPDRPGLIGRIDRFELLRILGRGGMSVVFLARDSRDGTLVALKTLAPEFENNPRVAERFLAEARHLQKLKHPDLVPVLEVREFKTGAFFTMPLYERSLADMMRAGVPLDREFTLNVALSVARGLLHAHSKGIIHRDIKPANILLQNGSIRLGDFGLARTLFNDASIDVEKEQCEGTAPYMSPAVAAGEAEDTRCDIYAAGALLYHLLTGKPPYQGESLKAVREQILAGPPPPVRQLNPKADPRLASIAEWAMAREARDRYATMKDLLADLRRVAAGGMPLGTRQARRPARLRVAVPPAVWGGAAVLLMCSLIWSAWPRTRLVEVLRFTHPKVTSWVGAQAVRLTQSPGDSLVLADPETDYRRLLAFSGDGELIKQWPNGLAPYFLLSLTRLTGGAQGERLFVVWFSNDVFGVSALNASLDATGVRFTAAGVPPHDRVRWAAGLLRPMGLVSFGTNSSPKLIAHLDLMNKADTNDFSRTRALLCYDASTGKPEWEVKVAARFFWLLPLDLDGDGVTELVFGGNAPGNNYATQDGDDDLVTPVLALSADGRRIWQRTVAGLYATATPFRAQTRGLGTSELLVLVTTHLMTHMTNGPIRSHVLKLDSRGGELKRYEPEARPCLHTPLPVDLDGDGSEEILIADCEGNIHVLDGDLELLRKARIFAPAAWRKGSSDHCNFYLVKANRFAGDETHILASRFEWRQEAFMNPGVITEDSDPLWLQLFEVILLDRDLKTVARHSTKRKQPPSVVTADMDADGLEEVVLLDDAVHVLKVKGY